MTDPTLRPIRLQAPRRRPRCFAAGAALALVLALQGCAGLQPKTAEEQVAERSQARWNALLKRDFATAWTFSEPGFREQVPQASYAGRFADMAQWQGAEVRNVACEAERCDVSVYVKMVALIPPFVNKDISGTMSETWVRYDGQWWFHQR